MKVTKLIFKDLGSAVVIAFILIIVIPVLCSGCKGTKRIVEKPIVFDEQRSQLTLEYMAERYGIKKDTPTIEPRMIVLHWTVYPTLEESFEAFRSSTLPNYRSDIEGVSGLNVSSHFLVDRDGTIYRLMPETTMARHVIGLNHCSIGIENVGGTDKNPLTALQLQANIWLINYLAKKYSIEYLIGHYEYTKFEQQEFWLEKNDSYRTEKEDPGESFMKNVRDATKKFNFKPVPENKIL